MSVTPTRKAGEKGKRSPTNDSPEERRRRDKTNRTTDSCILPIIPEKSDSEFSEIETDESDSDLDLPAPSNSKGTNRVCANTKSVLMTMSDLNNFSALLRNAFLDPETATAMRSVFKPLLDEQTQMIKEEIKEIKDNHTKLEHRTDNLEEKVTHLQEENTTLKNTLEQQQRFPESVNYDRRQHNLIITGLSEINELKVRPDLSFSTDKDKVHHILALIGHPDTVVSSMQRLGEQRGDNSAWPRPLKLTLHAATDRKKILQSTNALKTAGAQLSKVYIKKDTHPGIRREMKRLRDTEKREREKPDNQGRTVTYDWKARCVKVDGIIVDSYRPSFF